MNMSSTYSGVSLSPLDNSTRTRVFLNSGDLMAGVLSILLLRRQPTRLTRGRKPPRELEKVNCDDIWLDEHAIPTFDPFFVSNHGLCLEISPKTHWSACSNDIHSRVNSDQSSQKFCLWEELPLSRTDRLSLPYCYLVESAA